MWQTVTWCAQKGWLVHLLRQTAHLLLKAPTLDERSPSSLVYLPEEETRHVLKGWLLYTLMSLFTRSVPILHDWLPLYTETLALFSFYTFCFADDFPARMYDLYLDEESVQAVVVNVGRRIKQLFLSALSFLIFFLPLLHSFLAESPPAPPTSPPIPPTAAAPSTKTILDRLRAHPPPKRAVMEKASLPKGKETPSRSVSPARSPEYITDSKARRRTSSHVDAEATHFSTPRASMYAVEQPPPLSSHPSAVTIQEEETPNYIHSTEMAKLRVGEVKRGRKVVRPFH